jgi:DNA-binding transcriptional regulator LsrR (DeoR family)
MTAHVSASRVARMYRRGLTEQQIADELHISQRTVSRRLAEANEPVRLDAVGIQKFRAAKRRLEIRRALQVSASEKEGGQ